MAMRCVDLFCGAGGFSLGMERAGFDMVAAYDHWPPAVKCHQANHDYPCHEFDLSDVEHAIEHIGQYSPDVIVGGPPCQDFSVAGKRVEGTRADMTRNFARICRALNPDIVIMENVPPARDSLAWAAAKKIMPHYHTELILNASRYGVPQYRCRFFCIATRKRLPQLGIDILRAAARKPLSMEEYAPGLFPPHIYITRRTYQVNAIFSRNEPAPTILSSSSSTSIHPGYIITNNGTPFDNPEEIPGITLLQCATVQTFPDDYWWPEKKADTALLIGNAVPPKLAESLGKHILQAWRSK